MLIKKVFCGLLLYCAADLAAADASYQCDGGMHLQSTYERAGGAGLGVSDSCMVLRSDGTMEWFRWYDGKKVAMADGNDATIRYAKAGNRLEIEEKHTYGSSVYYEGTLTDDRLVILICSDFHHSIIHAGDFPKLYQGVRWQDVPERALLCEDKKTIYTLVKDKQDVSQIKQPLIQPQANVPRVCSDGSPMPASSVCPTITFPTAEERAKQERDKQEAARKAAEVERQRQLANEAERQRQIVRELAQTEEDWKKLASLPPLTGAQGQIGRAQPPTPAIAAVDEEIDDNAVGPTLAEELRAMRDAIMNGPENIRRQIEEQIRQAQERASRAREAINRRCAGANANAGEVNFNDTVCRSMWNAIPIVGTFIFGSRNVEQTGRMLGAAVADDVR